MKRNFFAMVAICVGMTMGTETMAQVRQTTTQASATPKCVVYEKLNASSVYVDDDCILYVEKGDNNAVVAIDAKTGEKQTVIPGIAGVYEGRRPRIQKAHKAGNMIFFTLENQEGGYVYDGQSVQTSPAMTLATDLCVTTDHHALFRSSRRLDGKLAYDLWDLRQDKHLVSFPYDVLSENAELYKTTLFIDQSGNVWTDKPISVAEGDNYFYHHGIMRITPEGRWDFYDLGKQDYVAENNVKPGCMFKKGDYIYRAAGRRIYRINTASPAPAWEEFAKIPPTQDSEFVRFAIDSNGNMLTNAGKLLSGPAFNNQYWRAGAFDSPQNLGSEIQSGISQYVYRRLEPEQCTMMTDANGNFVLLEKGGNTVYIYNPNGLAGYTKTAGTVVK